MRSLYLCGPINACTDEECNDWRQYVAGRWFGDVIDPMARDYRGRELIDYREIVDLDKRDVRAADIIMVNYIKPSVGTSMEVFYAWTLGKPIVVVCAPDVALSPWLIYHSTKIVHGFDAAVEWCASA